MLQFITNSLLFSECFAKYLMYCYHDYLSCNFLQHTSIFSQGNERHAKTDTSLSSTEPLPETPRGWTLPLFTKSPCHRMIHVSLSFIPGQTSDQIVTYCPISHLHNILQD